MGASTEELGLLSCGRWSAGLPLGAMTCALGGAGVELRGKRSSIALGGSGCLEGRISGRHTPTLGDEAAAPAAESAE